MWPEKRRESRRLVSTSLLLILFHSLSAHKGTCLCFSGINPCNIHIPKLGFSFGITRELRIIDVTCTVTYFSISCYVEVIIWKPVNQDMLTAGAYYGLVLQHLFVSLFKHLLNTVPSDVLSKGKAIADAYQPQDDVEPDNQDPELKQLESQLSH